MSPWEMSLKFRSLMPVALPWFTAVNLWEVMGGFLHCCFMLIGVIDSPSTTSSLQLSHTQCLSLTQCSFRIEDVHADFTSTPYSTTPYSTTHLALWIETTETMCCFFLQATIQSMLGALDQSLPCREDFATGPFIFFFASLSSFQQHMRYKN
jgi:hypothetical protein